VRALQAAPVLRPVEKAFGVQLRVGHCPSVMQRLCGPCCRPRRRHRTLNLTATLPQPRQRRLETNCRPTGADHAGRCERTGGASGCGDGARRGLGGRPASDAGGRMPSSVPHLRRARRAASLRVQLASRVSVCTIRSLRASQPTHCSRPAAGSDSARTGAGQQAVGPFGSPGSQEPPQTQPQGRARRRVDECPESLEAAHGRCAGDSREQQSTSQTSATSFGGRAPQF
jgi:hypothetical protein